MSAAHQLHPSLQFHLVNSLGWEALRPLQEAAIEPILAGQHLLLIAPTASGKTEAAVFPLLSRMLSEEWWGLSVLYVCPLRALLNNLEPRLSRYAGLVGRRVGLWHGDTSSTVRRNLLEDAPDLLLTTPESLEGMLVSRRVDHGDWFRRVRAVVVDEIHAFAGDDRGWHLLAVLERIGRLAGRELQRVGLSATVGNPAELVDWLAGVCPGRRRVLEDPAVREGLAPEVQLDHVQTLANAAKVIAALYQGEKRLVFCDSRARCEELAHDLRQRGVTTFVSHASLAREQRRMAEEAFTAERDCVIVATSTLELGMDIGDLDRVIQIDSPPRVASFLQRLGRTGRRPGTQGNCLFLTTTTAAFLRAAGILDLWRQGWVERVQPPGEPYHLLAQQLMALCLQEGGVGSKAWRDWLLAMPGFSGLDADGIETLFQFLLESGVLWQDGGLLWLGEEGERRYQRRNFLELLSTIVSDPLFTVLHGREEIGFVDQASFVVKRGQSPVLLLAGRSWSVEHVDWKHRRCWVSEVESEGRSRWIGDGQPLTSEHARAIRHVLLGAELPELTRRGREEIEEARQRFSWLPEDGTAIVGEGPDEARWWTFAGLLANATLLGALQDLLVEKPSYDNLSIVLPRAVAIQVAGMVESGELTARVAADDGGPGIEPDAAEALKFADCVPPLLLDDIIRARWSDRVGAGRVAGEPVVWVEIDAEGR